jgi:hypothetical protein
MMFRFLNVLLLHKDGKIGLRLLEMQLLGRIFPPLLADDVYGYFLLADSGPLEMKLQGCLEVALFLVKHHSNFFGTIFKGNLV